MPKNHELSANVKNSNVQTPLFADETAIVLTKESDEVTIRSYFEGILKLSQSIKDFPVNLDEVWMLAYSEKCVAVRALKKNFIEGVDFQPLDQNVKRSNDGKFNGENKITYMLSTSCLEYFIARKVRPVFEVYRQVFHKAVKPQVQDALVKYDRMLTESLKQTEEGLKYIAKLEKQLWEEKARVVIETEKRNAEEHVKNSMMSFLVHTRMYERWQKYDSEKKLKETIKKLQRQKEIEEMRPDGLPF